MRRLIISLVIPVILILSSPYIFGQTPPVEITSYDIKASLSLMMGGVQVAAELELNKVDTVKEFDLILNSDVKMGAIKSQMSTGSVDMPYQFAGKDTLKVTVPSSLLTSSHLILDFFYTFPVGESTGSLIVLDRGNRWYPLILDQIVPFKLTATVPQVYKAFSAGDLIGEKDLKRQSQFVWESKIPVFKLPLILVESKAYHKSAMNVSGKDIILYTSLEDQETQKKVLSEAGDAFKYFSGQIGTYPYNNLTLIEIPDMDGADIASGIVMLGTPSLQRFKQGRDDELLFSIACEWMAAGVFFPFLGKGFWFLQISLPHYLRLEYLNKSRGMTAFDQGLKEGLEAYKKNAGTENEVSILDVDFLNTKEKATAIYGKGPYVIDLVKKQMGDENWDKFLKDIYKNFSGKILTYDEFVSYLSKYDQSGKAVALLNKLVSEKGVPEEK
jgi:hypothetical protein